MKAPSPEECPADQLPKFISDVINDYDNEKTVVQTAQDFQLTLSSLKQVKIIIYIIIIIIIISFQCIKRNKFKKTSNVFLYRYLLWMSIEDY